MSTILNEENKPLRPAGWEQYAYFSDNAMKMRVPQTKKFRDTHSMANVDFRAIRREEEEATKLADGGWDKYYFFACPGDKSVLGPTAMKGRRRPAAEGPRTFTMDVETLEDDGRKLKETSYSQDFDKELIPDTYNSTASTIPHIFPGGHQTFNQQLAQHRPSIRKSACYTIV